MWCAGMDHAARHPCFYLRCFLYAVKSAVAPLDATIACNCRRCGNTDQRHDNTYIITVGDVTSSDVSAKRNDVTEGFSSVRQIND